METKWLDFSSRSNSWSNKNKLVLDDVSLPHRSSGVVECRSPKAWLQLFTSFTKILCWWWRCFIQLFAKMPSGMKMWTLWLNMMSHAPWITLSQFELDESWYCHLGLLLIQPRPRESTRRYILVEYSLSSTRVSSSQTQTSHVGSYRVKNVFTSFLFLLFGTTSGSVRSQLRRPNRPTYGLIVMSLSLLPSSGSHCSFEEMSQRIEKQNWGEI